MRIFAAGMSTDSNTFAPWPTGQRGFDEGGYWRGTASLSGDCEQNLVARLFRRMARDAGHVLIEGLFTVVRGRPRTRTRTTLELIGLHSGPAAHIALGDGSG